MSLAKTLINLRQVSRDFGATDDQTKVEGDRRTQAIIRDCDHLSARDARIEMSIVRMAEAMSGDMVLVAIGGGTDVAAADLNAAAANTFRRTLGFRLESAAGKVHDWASFDLPDPALAENVVDVDVGAPTLTVGTQKLEKGISGLYEIEFDTDAGVTKTYAPGDSVSATFSILAGSSLLGHAVADLVVTFDVV